MEYYDVHGLVTVASETSLPLPEGLACGPVDDPDVVVEVGPVAYDAGARKRYNHRFFWDPESRSVVVDWSMDLPSVVRGVVGEVRAELRDLTGRTTLRVTEAYRERADVDELLRTLLAFRLRRQGATFLYGAGLRNPDGEGVYLFGWNNTGKSSVTFELVRDHGWEYLGDDKLVYHDGDIYPYGATIGVSPRTWLPDDALSMREEIERRGRELASLLPLQAQFDFYPDSKLYLPPERLLPEDRILGIGEGVSLDRCFVLEPADEMGELTHIPEEELVRQVCVCNHVNGPGAMPWHVLLRTACYLDDRVDRETVVTAHGEAVREAATGVDAVNVPAPKSAYAEVIAGYEG